MGGKLKLQHHIVFLVCATQAAPHGTCGISTIGSSSDARRSLALWRFASVSACFPCSGAQGQVQAR